MLTQSKKNSNQRCWGQFYISDTAAKKSTFMKIFLSLHWSVSVLPFKNNLKKIIIFEDETV